MQQVHSPRVGDVERIRAAGPTACEVRDKMTRSLSWRLGRGASVTLVLLASLVLTGGEALAATQVAHSGQTGAYSFTDTTAAPGARCVYQGTLGHSDFDHARVKAPTVYWLSSGAFHSGTVGWRLLLQHWNGSSWVTVRTTSEARGLATRTTPAPLSTRNVSWAPPANRKYRVEVKIRWMTPDATTIGKVVVVIDHYRRSYDGSVGASCKARVANI
jgi:hypothetical protein